MVEHKTTEKILILCTDFTNVQARPTLLYKCIQNLLLLPENKLGKL